MSDANSSSEGNSSAAQPLGVPLDEIENRFRIADLEVSRDGDTLVLRHETPLHGELLQTRVAVMAPDLEDIRDLSAKAVIRIVTTLPARYAHRYNAEMTCFANRFASLGAFTVTEGMSFVGSRLTVYEDDADWDWQLPVAAVAAAVSSTPSPAGCKGFLRRIGRRPGRRPGPRRISI